MAPHSHARRLIQPLLQAAAERYPDILLHISENFEGVLADDLRMGRMDMALLYETVSRPGFQSRPVSTEPLYLVGCRGLARLQARRAERANPDAAAEPGSCHPSAGGGGV